MFGGIQDNIYDSKSVASTFWILMTLLKFHKKELNIFHFQGIRHRVVTDDQG